MLDQPWQYATATATAASLFTAIFISVKTSFHSKAGSGYGVEYIEGTTSPQSASIAYNATCFVACFLLVAIGFIGVCLEPPWNATAEERVLGRPSWAVATLMIMMGYQLWNLCVCLKFDFLRDPLNLFHHGLIFAAAATSLKPLALGYACFFFGVPELSSWFLCVHDTLNDVPSLRLRFEDLRATNRKAFAMSFILVRVVLWLPAAVCLARDAITVSLPAGDRAYVLGFTSSITLLQLYWSVLIVRSALRHMRKQRHLRLLEDGHRIAVADDVEHQGDIHGYGAAAPDAPGAASDASGDQIIHNNLQSPLSS